MKIFTPIAATVVAVMTFTGASYAESLKISHVRPQDSTIDQEIKRFAGNVAEATDDLELDIFAASSLGDYTDVQERISLGAVDMAVQPVATGVDRRMQISTLPYLAENWDEAREIFGPGGPVRETMEDLYAEQNIRVLAGYPVYFGGVSLNRPPESPGEVDVEKGIKVRVPEIKSFQLNAEALGYNPAPIPFSDAFTAVQTGVVDGVIGSGAEGYYASFRDVTQTYIPMNTHFEFWYMLISERSFASLDSAEQDALVSTAEGFEDQRWEVAEKDQAANEQRLADAGATIVDISDAQLEAAAEKARSEVWPEILDDIGEEWGQEILDEIDQ